LLEELEKVVVLALKELLQVGAMALKGRRGWKMFFIQLGICASVLTLIYSFVLRIKDNK
jgi:hypothetical protein